MNASCKTAFYQQSAVPTLCAVFMFVSLVASSATVRRLEGGDEPRFDRHVLPVLTKAGCNSASCHAWPGGRGGVELSLFGHDPTADYKAIARDGFGRQVSIVEPHHSLLLKKAVVRNRQFVGRRTKAYQIVHDWIARGAVEPTVLVRPSRLRVSPKRSVIRPGESSKLTVTCDWSDGTSEDISWLTTFSKRGGEVADEAVATVTDDGLVKGVNSGTKSFTARFLDQVAYFQVIVPFEVEPTESVAAELAEGAPCENNVIDQFFFTRWNEAGLKPVKLCSDAQFLRRASLHVAGRLPEPEQTLCFVESTDPLKREKLLDRLLASPEHVEHWAFNWSNLVGVHKGRVGEGGKRAFWDWMRIQLSAGAGADQIVSRMLLSEGRVETNPPVAFYSDTDSPHRMAEKAAQLFLGVEIRCARCHSHPAGWRQQDYHGLAAFFAGAESEHIETEKNSHAKKVDAIASLGVKKNVDRFVSLSVEPNHVLKHPRTGETVLPRVLGQNTQLAGDVTDPRHELARWMADRGNPLLARNLVNRYWAYLFGKPLFEPIDALPRSDGEANLLNILADDFAEHDYDARCLLRKICSSHFYQLSHEPVDSQDLLGQFQTRHMPTRLHGAALESVIHQFFGASSDALPDTDSPQYNTVRPFGPPIERQSNGVKCERYSPRIPIPYSLTLRGSGELVKNIEHEDSRLSRLLAEGKSDEEISEELFLAAMSRRPNEEERRAVNEFLKKERTRDDMTRKKSLSDLVHALANTREFLFIH